MSEIEETVPVQENKFLGFAIKGVGFFTNAYLYFALNIINLVLTKQWETFFEPRVSQISMSVFAGAVTGQLVLGALADSIGRKKIMLLASCLQIGGSLACAGALGVTKNGQLDALSIYLVLLGFGIGAEYPLSASSSAESADTVDERAPLVTGIFSLQGVGAFTAAVVGVILIKIFLPGVEPYPFTNLNVVWRLMFALAALPVISMFYFRWKMEESRAFTQVVEDEALIGDDDNEAAVVSVTSLTYVQKLSIIRRHYLKEIIGASLPWLLFDVVFYAQAIFSGLVISGVGTGDNLVTISTKNLLVVLGALPGYYVALCFTNKLGRKLMQLQGFLFMALIFFFMYGFWSSIIGNAPLFVFLYGLTFFFSNFGPNSSTFVIPVELFPTAIRSTCHGIASASGKIGAVIGVAVFAPMQKAYGTSSPFLACGIVALFGAIVTLIFIPWSPKTFSQLDEEFRMIMQSEFNNYQKIDGDDTDEAVAV